MWRLILTIQILMQRTLPLWAQFPAEFNLSSLNGDNGFILNDCGGYSVGGIDDINGDGIDDLVTGSTSNTLCVVFGVSHIGRDGVLKAAVLNGTNGFKAYGGEEYYSGSSVVSAAGDINHDGINDVIIGAKLASPNSRMSAGSSFLVFGKASGDSWTESLVFSTLNGKNGFSINGVASGDRSGASVSGLGDVNGDAFDDLIIGTPFTSPGNRTRAGSSYVLFGGPGVGTEGTVELSTLNGANGFTIHEVAPGDQSGFAVGRAGDMNGDGINDILIGAPGAGKTDSRSGSTYVIFGRRGLGTGGVLDLTSLKGDSGFVINGARTGDNSGYSVSGDGDLNGDGKIDLVIGASRSREWSFSVGYIQGIRGHVVFGKTGLGANGSIELSGLEDNNGFVIRSVATDTVGSVNDGFFKQSSIIRDINGDGFYDILIGSSLASPGGRIYAGNTYVIFGNAHLGTGGTFELASLNGKNGFSLPGIKDHQFSGFSVSGLGDINNDGANDFIIGVSAEPSYVLFGAGGSRPPLPTRPSLPEKPAETSGSGGKNLSDSHPQPIPSPIPQRDESWISTLRHLPLSLKIVLYIFVSLFGVGIIKFLVPQLMRCCLYPCLAEGSIHSRITNAVLPRLWVGWLGMMTPTTYAGYVGAIARIGNSSVPILMK